MLRLLPRGMLGAILIVGGAIGLFHNSHEYYLASTCRSWPTTPGKIFDSGVERQRSRRSTYFSPWVRYWYAPGGVKYEGSRIQFAADLSSPSYEEAASRIESYPRGVNVPVSYDPRNPATSVLVAGVGDNWFGEELLSVLMLALGVFLSRDWLRRLARFIGRINESSIGPPNSALKA